MEIQLFSFFCVIPAITIFTNFIFILIVVNLLLVKQTYLPTYLALDSEPEPESESELQSLPSKILPTSLLYRGRGVQLKFSRGPNLNRRLRFNSSQILPWSTTLLNERDARIFRGGCSLGTILAKPVPSLAPGTAPPFSFRYYHGKKFSLIVSLDLLPRGRF